MVDLEGPSCFGIVYDDDVTWIAPTNISRGLTTHCCKWSFQPRVTISLICLIKLFITHSEHKNQTTKNLARSHAWKHFTNLLNIIK